MRASRLGEASGVARVASGERGGVRMLFFLFCLLASCFWFPVSAHAACFNPAGQAGDVIYNSGYRTFQYCNGGAWVRMGGAGDTTSGLVSHWKLDEASGGTTLVDSVGTSNLTLTAGTITSDPGINGTALSCPAGTGTTKTSTYAPYDVDTFTVAFWAKPSQVAGVVKNAIGVGCGGITAEYMYQWGTQWNLDVSTSVDGGADLTASTPTGNAAVGRWDFVVGTYDGAAIKVYVDGVLQATQAQSHKVNRIQAGSCFYASLAGGYAGDLDDVYFYNRALSAADVMTLYTSTGGTSGDINSNLVGYWKLDEASGTSAADSSGNGNTGTYSSPVSPTPVSGKINNGLAFSGASGNISTNEWTLIGDPAALNFGAGSFSYGLWVYAASNAGAWDMPFNKGGSSTGFCGYDIELGTGPWIAHLSDGATVPGVNFAAAPMMSQWVHLFVVVDRASNLLKTYVNGAFANSTSIAGLGSVSSRAGGACTAALNASMAVLGGNYDMTSGPGAYANSFPAL